MPPRLIFLGLSALIACTEELPAAPYGPAPQPARLHTHFVMPGGSPAGDGTAANPWDLATAFAHPDAVLPGDTVWIGGGTYEGSFVASFRGTAEAPIIVRAIPGQRATIDPGRAFPPGLVIRGAHTWYWGLEITNSGTKGLATGGGQGVVTLEPTQGIKLIHLIIHDNWANGIAWDKAATGSEIYGVISYGNGRDAISRPGRGGYGLYAQPESELVIRDNIFGKHGGNFPIHIYGEQVEIHGVHLIGNIVAGGGGGHWVLIGAHRPVHRPIVRGNVIHNAGFDLGWQEWGGGTIDAVVEDNVFATISRPTHFTSRNTGTKMARNTLFGGWNFDESEFPDNTYLTSRPVGTWQYVRASAYEAGRAHVAVYNWGHAGSVMVDLSAVLDPGDAFTVRDAFDPFGPPLTEGIYADPVAVPTGGVEFLVLVVHGSP